MEIVAVSLRLLMLYRSIRSATRVTNRTNVVAVATVHPPRLVIGHGGGGGEG